MQGTPKKSGSHSRRGAKHGMALSDVYKIWTGMVQRCTNPKNKSFKRYGASGVSVSPSWRGAGGFEAFYSHIGPRPSIKHSVDRWPNKNGNYEPGNVRWATAVEQGNNKRTNRMVTRDGVTDTVTAWARQLGIDPGVVEKRVSSGWSSEDALTRPMTKKWTTIVNGVAVPISKLSRDAGLNPSTVRDRIRRGWTVEMALGRP